MELIPNHEPEHECYCLRRECESWGGACRASALLLGQVLTCHLPSLLLMLRLPSAMLETCAFSSQSSISPLFVDEKRKKCDFLSALSQMTLTFFPQWKLLEIINIQEYHLYTATCSWRNSKVRKCQKEFELILPPGVKFSILVISQFS